jgi:hypothetical protein
MSLLASAHCKMVLHAAKYPSEPVFGLLVGYRSKGTGETDGKWVAVDSVALFHSHALFPMLELAFLQVEAYCVRRGATEKQPLHIVGCYAANESASDTTGLSILAQRVGSKLEALVHMPLVLLLDAEKLGTATATRRFRCRDGRRWEAGGDAVTCSEAAAVHAVELLRGDRERLLCDLEDHLEDPARDYFNTSLVELKEQGCLMTLNSVDTLKTLALLILNILASSTDLTDPPHVRPEADTDVLLPPVGPVEVHPSSAYFYLSLGVMWLLYHLPFTTSTFILSNRSRRHPLYMWKLKLAPSSMR